MSTTEFPQYDTRPPAQPGPGAERTPQRRTPSTARTVLVAALVSALVSAGVTAPIVASIVEQATDNEPPPQTQQVSNGDPDTGADTGEDDQAAADSGSDRGEAASGAVARVSEDVSPSVVFIRVAGAAGEGSGSGVILREDGYILTNSHVVADATAVRVTLPDAGELDAEVVGADPSSDLAVIKVEAEDLPVADFADAAPRVGDLAVAIGSPFGLEGSVTSGIVSAVNRNLGGGDALLVDLIQTDAAINPGNSGGALVNGDSEVIGINTAIIGQANAGVGFAIPIQSALPIAEQLIDKGFVEHAQLGIQGQDIDPQTAELYRLGAAAGALVVEVAEGSAAEEAGLERGDIITAIDDEKVSSMAQLAGRIRAYSPGDEVTLTVMRDGEEETIDVTLGAAPRQQ